MAGRSSGWPALVVGYLVFGESVANVMSQLAALTEHACFEAPMVLVHAQDRIAPGTVIEALYKRPEARRRWNWDCNLHKHPLLWLPLSSGFLF